MNKSNVTRFVVLRMHLTYQCHVVKMNGSGTSLDFAATAVAVLLDIAIARWSDHKHAFSGSSAC